MPNSSPKSAHGGELVNLLVSEERAAELSETAVRAVRWTLTPRQLCDLELLACGGFSPLRSFLGELDYSSVCERMRLADDTLWPMPIMLDVPSETVDQIGSAGGALALCDPEGVPLALLQVTEAWRPDLEQEARSVFETTDLAHPGVRYLLRRSHPWYVSGELEVLQLPEHHDFRHLRRTPAELRAEFGNRGWDRVVAFQTRNPMHRAHIELTLRAARATGAGLLIHPVVGQTKADDIDHYTRVRCYQSIIKGYPAGQAMLSLLPLAMRMGGPREALWHAIIRKNYGASHFIVGRDHAGPGKDSLGQSFYGPYEAQDLLRSHKDELGVDVIPFRQMLYLAEEKRYVPEDEVPNGAQVLSLSGTELRRRLTTGEGLPDWFTLPSVVAELRRSVRPRHQQGVTVFLTGLSGAGKSTIAKVLVTRLLELGGRSVTLLDGDIVRQHLSSELGFSRRDRDINIRRIGYVASEIARHGGLAVCAPIAPYDETRKDVRRLVEDAGGQFVLVYVCTPVETCEARDRKGLYAKARAGIIPNFTGVSDPYEPPADADLVIHTTGTSPDEEADEIIAFLSESGLLAPIPTPRAGEDGALIVLESPRPESVSVVAHETSGAQPIAR